MTHETLTRRKRICDQIKLNFIVSPFPYIRYPMQTTNSNDCHGFFGVKLSLYGLCHLKLNEIFKGLFGIFTLKKALCLSTCELSCDKTLEQLHICHANTKERFTIARVTPCHDLNKCSTNSHK